MTKGNPTIPVEAEDRGAATKAESSLFEGLRREIDRLFDDFNPASWRLPTRAASYGLDFKWPGQGTWKVAPAMDLIEKNGAYEITAELPGVDEKDVELKLSNGTLTIKGQKVEEKQERDKEYYLSERRYGAFQRSFRLPEGVDTDKIDATFAKGVLTVTLPKTPDAQKSEKKISIKAA